MELIKSLLVVSIFIFLATVPVNAECDFGWTSRGLHCYYVSPDNATFDEAVESCSTFESELVYVDDDLENDFIFSISASVSGDSYWIGYQHIFSTIWRWLYNGRVGNFQMWDIAEPDGQGGCARLTPYNKGSWRDYPCDLRLNYICKKLADCGLPPPMQWGADMEYSRSAIPSLQANLSIYSAGTTATYTCLTGFEFLDTAVSKQVECAIGGIWSPYLSVDDPCIPKKCATPPIYSNGVNNGTDVFYDFGSTVQYTCNAGYWFDQYSLGQSRSLICANDKTWKKVGQEAPVDCGQVTCTRPITENAYANSSSNQKGVHVLYRCTKGSQFEDNSTQKVFVCGDDTWVPRPEKCLPIYCPDHDVVGAIPSTNETVYDTRVIWSCDRGLLYPDTSTRKAMYCQEDRKWDRLITDSCAPKTCTGPPPNATDLEWNDWNSTRIYKFTHTVRYTCIYDEWFYPGQPLLPYRDRFCNEDAEWEPQTIGDCTGDPVILVTANAPVDAKEASNAELVGSLGYIMIGALLVFIVVMDITTIGKHLAMMRDNLCPKPPEVVVAIKATNVWKQKMMAKKAMAAAAGADKPKTTIAVSAKDAEAGGVENEKAKVHVSQKQGAEAAATSQKQSVTVYHGSRGSIQDV